MALSVRNAGFIFWDQAKNSNTNNKIIYRNVQKKVHLTAALIGAKYLFELQCTFAVKNNIFLHLPRQKKCGSEKIHDNHTFSIFISPKFKFIILSFCTYIQKENTMASKKMGGRKACLCRQSWIL